MAETDWLLRPLEAPDCDELGRVHMAVWREAYAGLMPADYLEGLSDERCADRWRATAARPVDAPGRTLVVLDGSSALNLAAPARGTGVADRLLDDLVGGRDTSLWVLEGNRRARAFYARRGFVDEGGRDEHSATGAPELRMVRRHA